MSGVIGVDSTSPGLQDTRQPAIIGPDPLDSEDLRWVCPPVRGGRVASELEALLGQDRPLEALRTGLAMRARGYHVCVTGPTESGRTTLVRHVLEEMSAHRGAGPDRLFLHNLREPRRPRLLTVPRGRARQFQDDLEALLGRARDGLRAALAAPHHRAVRGAMQRRAEAREARLMAAFGRIADAARCVLVTRSLPSGAVIAEVKAVVAGSAVEEDVLAEMVGEGRISEAEYEDVVTRCATLGTRLEAVEDRVRRIRWRSEREQARSDSALATRVLRRLFKVFHADWPQPAVVDYLEEIVEWVSQEPRRLLPGDGEEGSGDDAADAVLAALRAHVVRTSAEDAPAPVVVETSPDLAGLIGAVDPPPEGAASELAGIRAGALLRADGGYLVVRAQDLVDDPATWSTLTRTLRSGVLELKPTDGTPGLQPEPIPIDVKVVLIGEPGLYEHLAAHDPQFLFTFKIHAEFDASVSASQENRQRYAGVLAWLSEHEGLRAFSPDAVAAMVEIGARMAGRRDRLSTCFGEIADVGREASLLCEQDGPGPVRRGHVARALRAAQARVDLAREQVERDMRDGYLLLPVAGEAVGQINSLTIVHVGTYAFGKPCRITASTGAASRGRSSVVNIEREAALSGALHDKGVLILGGYLLDRFGQDGPLCLQATLCLEQTYGGVDGDSASSAELFALLSSLSRIPLRQGIGVTGSVNQKGEIQAVSGLNEKIEGFFRHCAAHGLTGDQGVLMPRANVRDLMLDEDVVAAVREGRFSVHAIDNVDDGLRVLTGADPAEIVRRAGEALRRFRAS